MNTKQMKFTLAAIALGVASIGAQAAPAVLDTGLVRMGVGDNGGLAQGVGVGLSGPTGDAITPGCLCEGWGASASGTTGYTYGAVGSSGISSALLTTTTASGAGLYAQSVVSLSNGLQVTHTYTSAAGGKLFKVAVDLKNTGAGTLTDVRYARTLDWDVTPGFFSSNFTTVYGGTPTGPGGKVLTTSTDPFAVPDPLVFRGQDQDTNVVDTPGDKGGFFVFGFGDLAAGESADFDTFIGADSSTSGLLAALGSVGVEAYSYTNGNTPGTDGYRFAPAYGYGFVGLGLPPALAPEPGSMALVGLALAGIAGLRRRKVIAN
jgi:hypothetical protein